MSTSRILVPTLLALAACEPAPMTTLEALEALGEVNESARGEQATAEVVEISTDFTIGDALEAAAQAIADFWEAQAPCSTVTLSGATVIVDYGTLDDACVYNGHTFAGVTEMTVGSTTPGELEVLHTWDGFTNGETRVDGGATVTWSGDDDTRRVVTEHTWTDEAEGTTVDVFGDHTQGVLDDSLGILGGITMEGTRDWTSETGDWSLEMVGLELRLQDPAPQAGSLDLVNPDGKTLTVEYERVDDDTIQATLLGLRVEKVFHIHQLGNIEEVE